MKRTKIDLKMVYEINSGDLLVRIADEGAEIVSVIYKGKERVWQNENGAWNRHSPVLFPVCGNSAVIMGGKNYGIPFHGFVRDSVFSVEKASDDSITFSLKYNEETLKVYPFKFALSIKYTVNGNSIIVENAVKNLGQNIMQFALGRHDSFTLDGAVGEYKLCFEKDEEFLSQKHDESGRLVNAFVDMGRGKELTLPEDFLSCGRTIIFGGIKSGKLLLKSTSCRPLAEYSFKGIENLLFWRPDGAKMICIEPWSALPDKAGEEKEFLSNEKYYSLVSGEEKTVRFEIKYY